MENKIYRTGELPGCNILETAEDVLTIERDFQAFLFYDRNAITVLPLVSWKLDYSRRVRFCNIVMVHNPIPLQSIPNSESRGSI